MCGIAFNVNLFVCHEIMFIVHLLYFIDRHQGSKLSINIIGRNLKKISNSTLPKSPTTFDEIVEAYKNQNVMDNFGTTLQNGSDDDKLNSTEFYKTAYEFKGTTKSSFSYVVFASQNIVNSIKERIAPQKRRFLMDATFKVCPYGIYNQLLVIYIEYLGETTPFIFALMSKKSRRSYEHLFNFIKKNVIDLGDSVSIMTDFEIAMRNALRITFPQPKLLCCWFHFCQAAKKRALQTPQLYPYLHQHKEARAIYYKLLSLPLLPAINIIPEFRRLKVLALANHRVVFADFIKYFENQWIRKVRRLI